MKRRIYRIENGKRICGVCGGIAEYFDIDPVLVRALWLVLVLTKGVGVLAYFVCALLFPKETELS